jgi:light-regulated signal transduction histidine kinase (bacteriophytochrome)
VNEAYPKTDLTNCDREPIHILGAIQPIGFLIAVTSDWMVARVSRNISQFLDTSAEDLIGRPLTDVLPPAAIHGLRNRVAMLRGPDSIERIFGCTLIDGHQPFDIAIHMSSGHILIEAEPGTGTDHGDVTGTVRSMIARLDQAETMNAFFNEGARQVRALSGFDRVMVYRFAADGSGEVVAESAKPGIGSFLGLHYPATDIPAQARELYKRNLLRVITDVNAEPVPIVPQRDENGAPLDLSLSVLRAVSPIHIEYLKNMGVGASMSISILVEGQLWGPVRLPPLFAALPELRAALRGRALRPDVRHASRKPGAEGNRRIRAARARPFPTNCSEPSRRTRPCSTIPTG